MMCVRLSSMCLCVPLRTFSLHTLTVRRKFAAMYMEVWQIFLNRIKMPYMAQNTSRSQHITTQHYAICMLTKFPYS